VTIRRADAPAKVNLTLAVSERRPDGYHDLSTILVRVGLADRLTARPTGAGATTSLDADRLVATGLPAGPAADNLVLRALVALRRHLGLPASSLDVALEKVVPVAAGLGGGSSDAATAIAIASRAWGVTLDRAARLEVAAAVGSDVPFFALGAPAAWATGRGERLAALPAPAGAPACILAVGARGVATAAVFEAFDRARSAGGGATTGEAAAATERLARDLRAGLAATELVRRAAELRDANDLWRGLAALRPDVDELRASLEARSGRPWLLSGSGPTLFALYASLAEAREAIKDLESWPPGRRDSLRLIATGLGATHRPSIDTGGTA
jgi:4-diphosphocytidyl-2-C-methyl-D-erythritol kinase